MGEPVLKRARPEDAAALKKLWKITFGDEDSYLELFFRLRFVPERTLTAWVDGTLAGCTYLLPADFCGKPMLYGYAVAVDPAFQGRGLARLMQVAVMEEGERQGFLYAVRPASPGLFTMYENFGMKTVFYEHEAVFDADADLGARLKPALMPIEAAEYEQLRNAYLGQKPGLVVWDETAIAYAIAETRFMGGDCLSLRLPGGQAAALFRVDEEALYVKEVLCADADLPALAAALSAYGNKSRVRVRLPGGDTPAGMLYGAEAPQGAYLGLTLD